MGIATHSIKLLSSRLQRANANSGSIVTYGVQGVEGNYDEVSALLRASGYPAIPLDDKDIIYDDITQFGHSIHQSTFFKMLGFSHVDSIDIWDDEGPTILHDLNLPIAEKLWSKYDVVLDGGTSEHLFNLHGIFSNGVHLVKKGGIIIHQLPVAGNVNHGFYQFSPTLFFDFYKANNFEIVSADLLMRYLGNWHAIDITSNRFIHELALNRFRMLHIVFIARKLEDARDIIIPAQNYYQAKIPKLGSDWFKDRNAIIRWFYRTKQNMNSNNARRMDYLESIYQYYKFLIRNRRDLIKL